MMAIGGLGKGPIDLEWLFSYLIVSLTRLRLQLKPGSRSLVNATRNTLFDTPPS